MTTKYWKRCMNIYWMKFYKRMWIFYSKDGMNDILMLHNFIDEIITYCTISTKETMTIIRNCDIIITKVDRTLVGWNRGLDGISYTFIHHLNFNLWKRFNISGFQDYSLIDKSINFINNVDVLNLNLNLGPPNTQP